MTFLTGIDNPTLIWN